MTNFQVYKKVLSFSFLQFVFDILVLAIIGGAGAAGFFIANSSTSRALLGLVIGIVIGTILATLISIFITNRIKAAQIAMMVKGVTEGEMPEHAFKAGFEEIRGRFAKITLFFLITNAIKGIFRQLGKAVTNVSTAIGGQVGGSVASTIDSAVQTVISYLCDCCLGWILYRKDQNSALAACEGAVIFFKHGKTLIRNVGRIFGMGFLSFLVVGGAFFGISYLIFMATPGMFNAIITEIQEIATRQGGTVPEFLNNPTFMMLIFSGIIGIIMQGIIHSVLVRPFILTGVLRNFMAAGKEHIPSESEFAELEKRSPKFSKLREMANKG